MKLHFFRLGTLIGCTLMLGMLRASYWQWERYHEKQAQIITIETRLERPVISLTQALNEANGDWSKLFHRRIRIEGEFDYTHEMLLKNRRWQNIPGVQLITPFLLKTPPYESFLPLYILVNRGFIPLTDSNRDTRKQYQRAMETSVVGMVQNSADRKFLSPSDPPTGLQLPWVDSWLRVDIPKMGAQLPYTLLPIYIEETQNLDGKTILKDMLSEPSGQSEIFFLPAKETKESSPSSPPAYPLTTINKIIPPHRHFGYMIEWAFMALLTFFLMLVMGRRRGGKRGLCNISGTSV